jgi:hypothetical protein
MTDRVREDKMKLGDTLKECKTFKTQKLQVLLNCLTLPQLEKFKRLFPGEIQELEEADLNKAIDLCERTILKNEKRK